MTRDRVADDPRSTHVYYCFTADGTLLYIGCALHPRDRFYFHRHYSGQEWPHHVARVVIGPALSGLAAARKMERAEIQRLAPPFNKHHNPARGQQPLPRLDTRRPLYERPSFVDVPMYPFDVLPTEPAS